MPEPWLSADDISTHLGVTKDTVYAWIAEKGMPAHKIGRLWKFQVSEIDDWVRRGGASGGDHEPLTAPQTDVGGHPYAHDNEDREGRR